MEVMKALAEVMEAFVEVTFTEIFLKSSVEASMEHMEDMKYLVIVNSIRASTKVCTKAFMEVTYTRACVGTFMGVMETIVDVMETFMEVTSTEVVMKASVKVSMKDMVYSKASVDINSLGASTKVSTKASMEVTSMKASIRAFIGVMDGVAEVMEAFMEMTSTETFIEASVEASMEDIE